MGLYLIFLQVKYLIYLCCCNIHYLLHSEYAFYIIFILESNTIENVPQRKH